MKEPATLRVQALVMLFSHDSLPRGFAVFVLQEQRSRRVRATCGRASLGPCDAGWIPSRDGVVQTVTV
jgi:hypothetical protein